MTQCPVVSSTLRINAGVIGVGGGMELMQPRGLHKSASSSALQGRHDRRSSNPAANSGDWRRRGPPSSSGGAANSGTSGSSRRPSVPGTPLSPADSLLGHRPPKPHRGLP